MVISLTASFQGTTPEKNVYRALQRLGYKEGEDFFFQSSQLGGRLTRGGVVLDFYLPSLNLAINVQGKYWHLGRPSQLAIDRLQKIALESIGITVIYIDEDHANENAIYYVEEALKFRDHSRVGTGL